MDVREKTIHLCEMMHKACPIDNEEMFTRLTGKNFDDWFPAILSALGSKHTVPAMEIVAMLPLVMDAVMLGAVMVENRSREKVN